MTSAATEASEDQLEPINIDAPPTADTADERLRLLAISAAGFCVFLSVYAPQSLLPYLKNVFQTTEAKVSWVITATTLAVAISGPAVGIFAQRVGRKKVIVGSILLLSIPTFCASRSSTLFELISWRFAQGLIMPGIIAVTMAYVSEHWPPHRVGKAMAAYVTGNVLGGVLGRLISGWLGGHYIWQASFVLLSVVDLAGAWVVWRGLPGSRVSTPPEPLDEVLRQFRGHFRNRQLLSSYAAGSLLLLILVALFTYITFRLELPPFNLGPADLGLLFLVYLVGIVVTPIGGWIIDRIGQRRAILGALCFVGTGVALTLLPSLTGIVIGLAFASSGVFICQAANAAYMGLVAGKDKASASGLYASFYYLGGAGGAFIPGLFWKFGGWTLTGSFLLLMTLMAWGIAWTYRRSFG